VDIFMESHIEPPTTAAITKPPMPKSEAIFAKSSPRNMLFNGRALLNSGDEYRSPDNSTKRSGADGRVRMIAQYRPRRIGICITIGPRQPSGLIPFSRYILIVS